MTSSHSDLKLGTCPDCGGLLSEPISGDVHCYVECAGCGERFDLKDPRVRVD